MKIASVEKVSQRKPADIVVIPFWQGSKTPEMACSEKEFAKSIAQPIKAGDFHGKQGETLLLYCSEGKEERILLLGLGKKNPCLPDNLRCAYASAIKVIRAKKIKKVNFLLPTTELLAEDISARAAVEGVLLSCYTFESLKGEVFKKENQASLAEISFAPVGKKVAAVLKKTEVIIDSVNFVRDLVNGNADDVTSEFLTACAKKMQKENTSIRATILGKKELEKENMGLMLAVNRGAMRDPALIILEYKGDSKSKESTAVIGKGITYDTGGLNIKPTGSMETMKCDMAGAAAALGLMQAAARLKLETNLIAVLAVAENAIGPHSYKPGDVCKSRLGKTVEIANTDAEGRLVLADAITYIQDKYKPARIIDLATLTGAIVVALGEDATGLFCNNEDLAKSLQRAGQRTHEIVWRMPLFPEHTEMMKSSIADLKNSGGRKAGSSTAAAFLQEFVRDVPWAHLDIAGTAYLSELKSYHTTHATGVGVRLLVDFLEHLNAKP